MRSLRLHAGPGASTISPLLLAGPVPLEPPVVVLVGTSHPGNAGAAARGAANFGVEELRFVAPRCDVKGSEAVERAVHAADLLRRAPVHATLAEALEGTSLAVGTTARTTTAENRFLRKPLDVRDWAESLVAANFAGRLALVFGPEDTGLTAEEVNLLDQLVTVPTATYASLNVAHAVSLLCYEHFRVRQAARVTAPRELSPGALAALNKAFDEVTTCVEPRRHRREVARGIWRKILGRSLPADYEVHNIMGIFTNTLRRFDHPDYASPKSRRSLGPRGMIATPAHQEPGYEEE